MKGGRLDSECLTQWTTAQISSRDTGFQRNRKLRFQNSQGEKPPAQDWNSQAKPLWLSWQSTRLVSERPWAQSNPTREALSCLAASMIFAKTNPTGSSWLLDLFVCSPCLLVCLSECLCPYVAKQISTLPNLCVSSLRRGHANLLCIVPILTDDPRRESVTARILLGSLLRPAAAETRSEAPNPQNSMGSKRPGVRPAR